MGSYWRKRIDHRVAFAAPAGEWWTALILLVYLMSMALWCFWHGMDFLVGGTAFLLMATLPFTNLGVNEVAFDLNERTYARTIYGRSLPIGNDAVFSSLGNPLRRRVVSGPMEDIAGIRIFGRMGRGRASNGKRYAIHIEWADYAQPSMVVGVFTNLWDAENQANVIAEMFCLPILEIDDRS